MSEAEFDAFQAWWVARGLQLDLAAVDDWINSSDYEFHCNSGLAFNETEGEWVSGRPSVWCVQHGLNGPGIFVPQPRNRPITTFCCRHSMN